MGQRGEGKREGIERGNRNSTLAWSDARWALICYLATVRTIKGEEESKAKIEREGTYSECPNDPVSHMCVRVHKSGLNIPNVSI